MDLLLTCPVESGNAYTNTHTHIHSVSRLACPECWWDNLMNLPNSMCAHLLVQPLVPTSITTTLLSWEKCVYLCESVQVWCYKCKTVTVGCLPSNTEIKCTCCKVMKTGKKKKNIKKKKPQFGSHIDG